VKPISSGGGKTLFSGSYLMGQFSSNLGLRSKILKFKFYMAANLKNILATHPS
jgi:hypothetical protein